MTTFVIEGEVTRQNPYDRPAAMTYRGPIQGIQLLAK